MNVEDNNESKAKIHTEWELLKSECASCKKCELHKKRTNVVFGRGSEDADILFIGEGPGEDEDREGKPFVGRAGKLLDQVILALELPKSSYYIANIVKCRPPGNRDPKPEEAAACIPYLRRQTKILKPKILVCLGKVASQYIYNKDVKITKDRGKVIKQKGFIIIPTFHPAYLLRNESGKKYFWEDMLLVRKYLHEMSDKNEIR
jgi:uracil-DNA glycosylase family 4